MLILNRVYPENIELLMKQHYDSLNEKDKRRYAAIESLKIEYYGEQYISSILNVSVKTIQRGKKELIEGINVPDGRVRIFGGGRKKNIDIIPDIHEIFKKILENHTAGEPMKDNVKWTNLTPKEISIHFEEYGLDVSEHVVKQLLEANGYVKRKAQKKESFKYAEHRDEQFIKIQNLKDEYIKANNPVISMDVKKKEAIGNFYRDGVLYTTDTITVLDHDFLSYSDGTIIPHGIYDIQRKEGYITIGTSKDTSEFACESLKDWWENTGKHQYPNATSILILADGGGSNSSRHYIFKQDLQNLANEIGVEIRMAHYPPYTSRYNPIEHRLFCHVTRACQGVVFKSHEIVKELMEKTTTTTGLRVIVNIKKKIYETGRQVSKSFKENMPIVFDNYLGKWNYRAIPLL